MMFRRSLVGVLALAAGLPAAARAHTDHGETDYGKPGDPKKPARIVQVVMREADGRMLFVPDRLKVRKGEQIRFLLRNNGEIDHEFVIGTVEDRVKRGDAGYQGRSAVIVSVEKQPGVDNIRLPSENSFKTRARLKKEGIEIDRKIYDALKAVPAGKLPEPT